MPEHGQRTGDLFYRGVKRREVMAFFRIPEKGIKRLFDLRQTVLDFPGDLTD
jgi:hypothetical protein